MGRTSTTGAGALGAAVTILVALLAAPGAQQPPAQQPPAQQPPIAPQGGPPAPTKALVPVAASSLVANPEPYYGEWVSLSATVDQTLAPLAFSVDQDRTKSTGKDVLVLAPRLNSPVDLNTYVTVLGEVMKFDPAEMATRAKDYKLDLPPDVVAKYHGRPVVLATAVINAGGVDVARRLPPPMSAEEQAFQKIMLQVGPANAALRKAIEGSDVKIATENAAALKLAFTQTEAFWKTKGRADAMQWAADARKLAEAIDRSAVGGKWDEVKATSGDLAKACATCHNAYRERFDDGAFRIKIPQR